MAICWFLRISSFNYEVFHGSLLTGDFFSFFFNFYVELNRLMVVGSICGAVIYDGSLLAIM